MPKRGELIPMEGSGASIPLLSDTIKMGRGERCDVAVDNGYVSRLHAELVWDSDRWVLIHRSGANVTLVNGEVVESRRTLEDGDQITLAPNVRFRLSFREVVATAELPIAGSALTVPGVGPPTTEPDLRPEPMTIVEKHPEIHLAIVGAGPGGIAAAVQAAHEGVPHTLIERSKSANTIELYQKGKLVMAEPERLPLQEGLRVGFEQGTREEVLAEWNSALERSSVNLRTGPQFELTQIAGKMGAFQLTLKDGQILEATHVILSIGVQGTLRTFGVSGDDLPHVSYQLDDPAAYEGKQIVVVGSGDAGIENALALADHDNDVSIVNRRREFARAKPRNRSLIESAIKNGEIGYYPNSTVLRLEERAVWLTTEDGEQRLEADLVIGRLGAIAPRRFLEDMGIEFSSSEQDALPEVSGTYESNVPGIHVIGALAGYPLIKNCMNQGYEVVEAIRGATVVPADEPVLANHLKGLKGSVSDILDQIRNLIPLFSGLTTIQLREFLFDSEIKYLEPETIVFSRNDFTNTFFAIVRGSVELLGPASPADEDSNLTVIERESAAAKGRRSTLNTGDFFGVPGLVSGRRRASTVTTKSHCILIEVSRLAMNRLLRSSDSVRTEIDRTLINSALAAIVPNVQPEKLAELASSVELVTFNAGAPLFREGDKPDGLYFIRRGSVSLTKQKNGRDTVVQYVQAGNYLGEMALLAPTENRGNGAKATVKVDAMLLPTEAVIPFFEANPLLRGEFEYQAALLAAAAAAQTDDIERGTVMWLMDNTGAHEATDLLLIDESLCIRCDNCEKACAWTHEGISRLKRESGPTYETSRNTQLHIPTACQHCENPKCMDDCPPDALRRDSNGEVYIKDNCIGCGNCASACPYGVIQMAAVDELDTPSMLSRILFGAKPRIVKNPDAQPAAKHAVKCELCRALPEPKSGRPKAACVASCPTGAIVRVNPRDLVNEIVEQE